MYTHTQTHVRKHAPTYAHHSLHNSVDNVIANVLHPVSLDLQLYLLTFPIATSLISIYIRSAPLHGPPAYQPAL